MVKFHILSMTLMNSNNRVNHGRTKATAAIPMAGAIVTAALLLSGLSLITSYQPVMAQENMTGGGVEGGGATTSTTDNATSTMGGAAQGGNATTTTTGGGGANQSTSDVRMNIEQARMALQNNDTQGAMMYLDMALSALGGGDAGTQGNMTSTTTSGSGTTNATSSGSTMGATTEGGAATSGSGGTTAGGPTAGQGEGSGGGAAGSGGTTAGQ